MRIAPSIILLGFAMLGGVGCSSSSDDDGGGSSGGRGGSGSTAPAKFCNRLTAGGADVTLTLTIGEASISAPTGVCGPVDQCLGVPAGTDVPMSLSDSGTVISSGTYSSIPGGEEMVFVSIVDTGGTPSIEGWVGNGICSGGDGTAGTVAKFCNQLSANGQSVTLTLDLGGATVSAATGSCAPVAACLPVTSGVDVPIALLDGGEIIASGTFPDVPSGASMLFVAEIDDVAGGVTITGGPYEGICGPGSLARVVGAGGGARKSANRSYFDRSLTWQVTDHVRLGDLVLRDARPSRPVFAAR